MRERPSNKGTPKTVSRASNLPKSQSLRVTFSHTAADYIGAAAVSHSVVWPGTSGAFDGGGQLQHRFGAGQGGCQRLPQADQRFHCFDLEEPLKQAIKLGHELVFYFQLCPDDRG